MAKCIKYNKSPSYCYKVYKCKCAICISWKKDAARRTNDKELAKKRSREWRLKHPERSRANSINYQKNHPDKVLEWKLKRYNLSVNQYKRLVDKQNNTCAICGKSPSGMQNSKKRLCVDHDSRTSRVRGLLCGNCNVGIGHFFHTQSLLQKAIEYLNGDVYE